MVCVVCGEKSLMYFWIIILIVVMDKVNIGNVCATGVGFALAYLGSKLIEKSLVPTKSPEEVAYQSLKEKRQQQKNNQEVKKLIDLQQLLVHKSQQFQIERQMQNNQILTKKCIMNFLWETIDLIDSEEVNCVIGLNRKARRTVFKQIEQKCEVYFRFVVTLDENVKYLLEKCQKDFAVFLNLDYSDLIASISYHSDYDDSDNSVQFRIRVMEILSNLRDSLQQHLYAYKNPVKPIEMQEVIEFQIELLENEKEKILEMVKRIGIENREEEEALPIFLSCYIDDWVKEEFRYESEQLSVAEEEMTPALKGKLAKFKEVRDALIEQLHLIVQDNIIINSEMDAEIDH